MLRSNSKRAREHVRAYIIENYNGDKGASFEIIARDIHDTYANEKLCVFHTPHCINKRVDTLSNFADWCQGLPSILDTCYYYNRSAVKDLAGILEETSEEASKYTEDKAEATLTYLIYSEIMKAL